MKKPSVENAHGRRTALARLDDYSSSLRLKPLRSRTQVSSCLRSVGSLKPTQLHLATGIVWRTRSRHDVAPTHLCR